MLANEKNSIKLDAFGGVDYRYYVDQAHNMRSEAVAALAHRLIERIKKLVKRDHSANFHPA